MLEEAGVVVEVDGARCIVELLETEACGACSAGCAPRGDGTRRRLSVSTPAFDLKPGDRIVVGIPARQTLLAAAVLYLGSLVMLFIGSFAGLIATRWMWPAAGDIGALSGGAIAFALYLLVARQRGLIEAMASVPVISRRVDT
jgi:positive regulator of sigma E activity